MLENLQQILEQNFPDKKFNIKQSKRHVSIDYCELEQDNGKLTPEKLGKIYNEWATENNRPKVAKITGKRLLGIKKAIKEYPTEEEWKKILCGISKSSFWVSVMDFDKLYRNERYHEFYESGINSEESDPLLAFFKKHSIKED